MSTRNDIGKRRAILATIRMRFAPQIQPIKDTAEDRVIENILHAAAGALSLTEIQRSFSTESGGYSLNRGDMQRSVNRLVACGRVEPVRGGAAMEYRLSAVAEKEIAASHDQAHARLRSVVARLCPTEGHGPSYDEPFLACLTIVFSGLGEQSVRLIKGDIQGAEVHRPRISSAVQTAMKQFARIDRGLLENALVTFFQEHDPDYDAIKWHMAQNYFVLKALGLDAAGSLLSKEVFENALFFLDTNLIIEALEPTHAHHGSFVAFANTCKRVGIGLKVCQVSLDELRRWLHYQRELMAKAIRQIPDDTAPKVQSIFYELYRQEKAAGESLNVEDLFGSFESPMDDLRNMFGVELVDDVWFDRAKAENETRELAQYLIARYSDVRGPERKKGRAPAEHDAILLLWLQKVRQEGHPKSWIVTTDTSLPGSVPPQAEEATLAVTLDSVLQWMSPLIDSDMEEGDFTSVFADLMKYRLLPQDRFFVLEDFLIFEEMHMSCRELPAADVEECIRYVKQHAPSLDPANPSDREKLAYEVSKFFADPGRVYKQELARLEKEKTADLEEYESKLREAEEKEREARERTARQETKYQTKLEQQGSLIQQLTHKLDESKRADETRRVKRSAVFRLGITAFLFLSAEAAVTFLANRYGEGGNLFQKVLHAWPFLGGLVPIFMALGWFLVGEERVKALGGPVSKLLKLGQ